MAPVVHGLEQEYSGRITFAYLDIDDDATEPFKQRLGYAGQPHYFLVDATGAVVQDWRGRVPAAEFRTAFDRFLAR